MTTLTKGQSAVETLAIGDYWLVTKTALSEGTFAAISASGVVKDAGVFGNTNMTNKQYGPYDTATTLTIACTQGTLSYTKVVAGSGGGGASTILTIVEKDVNYNLQASDSSSVFRNTSATGTVILTLPAWSQGLKFSACITAAQILEFLAQGTDVINSGATSSAAAGNIQASLLGNYITLEAVTPGKWQISNIIGDWTMT